MNKVILTSHPKSGRKLFRAIWQANIEGWEIVRPDRNHLNPFEGVRCGNVVLLVRDGRDVMTTAYYVNKKEMKFSEYLNYPYRNLLGQNKSVIEKMCPIEYWVRFNQSWLNMGDQLDRLIIIRFEYLLEHQEEAIRYLRRRLPAPHKKIKLVKPEKGLYGVEKEAWMREKSNGIGKWMGVFTHEDRKKFDRIAAPIMSKLAYYTEYIGEHFDTSTLSRTLSNY